MRMVKRSSYIVRVLHVFILFCSIAMLSSCGSTEVEDYAGIGPEGGTVTSSDGKASVNIPPDALVKKTQVSIKPVSEVPAGHIWAPYEFLPDGINFLKPVTISISYEKDTLPSGLKESDLRLGKINNNILDEITDSKVDIQDNVVSAEVGHFSSYNIVNTGKVPTGVKSYPVNSRLMNSIIARGITLRWKPVLGATSYNIYWSTTSGVSKESGNQIPGVTSPYTHDEDLIFGKKYYYVVTAVKDNVEEDESLETEALPGKGYISGGDVHAAVLKKDGTVWTWGQNTLGQLGDGTTTDRTTPVQVNGLSDVIAVAAGRTMIMALKSDGTVWTWGLNNYGELGDGSTVTYGKDADGKDIKVIRNVPGPVVGLNDVVAIAAGRSTGAALKNDGTVWTWGENTYGTLGDGNTNVSLTSGSSATPVRVIGLTDIVSIALKRSHILALKSDGTVWAWGHNRNGQFGNGEATGDANSPGPVPVQVSDISDPGATIATGYWHSMALKSDGTVWTWGDNEAGELCDGTLINQLTPEKITGLYDLSAIEGGEYQTIALKRNGTVWMCGNNSAGQLGIGAATEESINTPVQVIGLTNVVAITSGKYFSTALKGDGTIWTWGVNNKGQLGDETTTNRAAPVQVLMDQLF